MWIVSFREEEARRTGRRARKQFAVATGTWCNVASLAALPTGSSVQSEGTFPTAKSSQSANVDLPACFLCRAPGDPRLKRRLSQGSCLLLQFGGKCSLDGRGWHESGSCCLSFNLLDRILKDKTPLSFIPSKKLFPSPPPENGLSSSSQAVFLPPVTNTATDHSSTFIVMLNCALAGTGLYSSLSLFLNASLIMLLYSLLGPSLCDLGCSPSPDPWRTLPVFRPSPGPRVSPVSFPF